MSHLSVRNWCIYKHTQEANQITVFPLVKLVAKKVSSKYQIPHSLSEDCLRLRLNVIMLLIYLFIFIKYFISVSVAVDPKPFSFFTQDL